MTASYGKQLQQAIREFLPSSFFSQWPVRAGVRWTPQRLAWTAPADGLGRRPDHASTL